MGMSLSKLQETVKDPRPSLSLPCCSPWGQRESGMT